MENIIVKNDESKIEIGSDLYIYNKIPILKNTVLNLLYKNGKITKPQMFQELKKIQAALTNLASQKQHSISALQKQIDVEDAYKKVEAAKQRMQAEKLLSQVSKPQNINKSALLPVELPTKVSKPQENIKNMERVLELYTKTVESQNRNLKSLLNNEIHMQDPKIDNLQKSIKFYEAKIDKIEKEKINLENTQSPQYNNFTQPRSRSPRRLSDSPSLRSHLSDSHSRRHSPSLYARYDSHSLYARYDSPSLQKSHLPNSLSLPRRHLPISPSLNTPNTRNKDNESKDSESKDSESKDSKTKKKYLKYKVKYLKLKMQINIDQNKLL